MPSPELKRISETISTTKTDVTRPSMAALSVQLRVYAILFNTHWIPSSRELNRVSQRSDLSPRADPQEAWLEV